MPPVARCAVGTCLAPQPVRSQWALLATPMQLLRLRGMLPFQPVCNCWQEPAAAEGASKRPGTPVAAAAPA